MSAADIELLVERAITNRLDDEHTVTQLRRSLRDLAPRLSIFFDGFDEIGSLRGSTEDSIPLLAFARAIDEYMAARQGRAVVAGRIYREPKGMGWPVYTVQGFERAQQLAYVERAIRTGLLSEREGEIARTVLGGTPVPVQHHLDSPLFLYLLCGYVKATYRGPEHPFDVYDRHFNEAFGATATDPADLRALRSIAALVAAAITLEPEARPTSDHLCSIIARFDDRDREELTGTLARLADEVRLLYRIEPPPGERDDSVKFSHTRFQEHFASVFLAEQPELIPVATVLRDAQWREPAVMALQTDRLPDLRDSLLSAAADDLAAGLALTEATEWQVQSEPDAADTPIVVREVPWPPRSRHILDLVSQGAVGRGDAPPEAVTASTDVILASAVGIDRPTYDRQSAVTFVGAASERTRLELLRTAEGRQQVGQPDCL